jgi:hypothetical protein
MHPVPFNGNIAGKADYKSTSPGLTVMGGAASWRGFIPSGCGSDSYHGSSRRQHCCNAAAAG